MPEAKTFGGGGPPPVQQCSLSYDTWDVLSGGLPDAKSLNYTIYNAPATLLNFPVITAGIETITVFAVVIDDGTGTYEIDIDDVPQTPINIDAESLDIALFITSQTAISTVAAAAHTVKLKLTAGAPTRIYFAYMKVLVTHCIALP
jgi:hypothetical protein